VPLPMPGSMMGLGKEIKRTQVSDIVGIAMLADVMLIASVPLVDLSA